MNQFRESTSKEESFSNHSSRDNDPFSQLKLCKNQLEICKDKLKDIQSQMKTLSNKL